MSVKDRVRWDTNYNQRDLSTYPDPDPFLKEFAPRADPNGEPRALDLAGGLGQNGLWLAEQGYAVDIMDISRVALQRARAEMGIRNVRNVNLLQVDLDTIELKPDYYDLLCVFRYLKRDLFPLMKQATVPGGRIIYETFNTDYLSVVPGFNRAFLLDKDELAGYFTDWHNIFQDESDHISRLVAVKPPA